MNTITVSARRPAVNAGAIRGALWSDDTKAAVAQSGATDAREHWYGPAAPLRSSESVSELEPRESRRRFRNAIGHLTALLVPCGAVATAVSACALRTRHSSSASLTGAMDNCPEQEGYPDCEPYGDRASR